MTLPVANSTRPSAPLNLTAQVLNGTLFFDWGDSVVSPAGTRYRVLRYPGSLSLADSKEPIWQGDASFALIPAVHPTSPYWYQVQAWVGSDFSDFEPNTYGRLFMPNFQGTNAVQGDIVPDGEFFSGPNVGSFWQLSANSINPLSITFPHSAGVVNDRSKISFTASYGSVGATLVAPQNPQGTIAPGYYQGQYPVAVGQWINVFLAYRRTGTLTGSSATGGQAGFRWLLNIQSNSSNDVATQATLPTSQQQFVRCDNLALNQWTFSAFSYQVPSTDNWSSIFPTLQVTSINLTAGGAIEIGRFHITRT